MRKELKLWFDTLRESPHAFTHTVYQIGWKGKASSEILAFGPSKTVGVKNNSHVISGWDSVGDYAEYPIYVHEAGTYSISMVYSAKKLPKGTIFQAVCNGKSTQHELLNNKNETLGSLHLEEGEHVFRLKIASLEGKLKPELSINSLKLDRL